MTDSPTPERHMRLDLCYNLRDAGGYPAHGGRRVRWRRLLRSDSLHALTHTSQQALRTIGLRTIIDLRRPTEATLKPNVFASAEGMAYHNLPVFGDADAMAVDYTAEQLEEMYVRFVELCQPQLRAIVQMIAEAAEHPLLIHCAVGKDRTGVVVALIQSSLGVAPTTIVEDYAQSQALLAPLFEIERPNVPAERRARFERVIQSPHTAMQHLLGHLDTHYGGVGGYFERIGIGAEHVERLHASLLE